MKLKNIKKVPFEIATILAANQKIIRLIYNDNPSVLTDQQDILLTTQQLIGLNYIGFYPATETGKTLIKTLLLLLIWKILV